MRRTCRISQKPPGLAACFKEHLQRCAQPRTKSREKNRRVANKKGGRSSSEMSRVPVDSLYHFQLLPPGALVQDRVAFVFVVVVVVFLKPHPHELVGALSAHEDIGEPVGPTVKPVVAVEPRQGVEPAFTEQPVVAAVANQQVVASVAVHDVGAGGADERIVAVAAIELIPGRVGAAVEVVVAIAAPQLGDKETQEVSSLPIPLSPCLLFSLSSAVPKITDFGLAKLLGGQSGGPTQSGDLLGTPSYMAPEQVGASTAPISAATDVYGLGATLYELLTGRPPFKGETALETMVQSGEKAQASLRVVHENPSTDRIITAFSGKPSAEAIQTAGFHDDAGFCAGCAAFYCEKHWSVSATGFGTCPQEHGKSLDPHWHPVAATPNQTPGVMPKASSALAKFLRNEKGAAHPTLPNWMKVACGRAMQWAGGCPSRT
jgi:hypothetical protein